jgi:hypothetical protein
MANWPLLLGSNLLLHAYRQPERPSPGAAAPTEVFHAAVRAAKVGQEKDIPHLSAGLINKYVSDLCQLGLLRGSADLQRLSWWPGPGSNRRPSAFQADARTN